MQNAVKRLTVCWRLPSAGIPEGAEVLSFLGPADEARLVEGGAKIHSGREASLSVRSQARKLYVRMVAKIGASEIKPGKTLRQSMVGSGGFSRWYYHPFSSRDCESSTVFDSFLQILTIREFASIHGFGEIVLLGASPAVSSVLDSASSTLIVSGFLKDIVRGIAGRFAGLKSFLQIKWRLARLVHAPERRGSKVKLIGFWNWSFRIDEKSAEIVDRYFKKLPKELEAVGISSPQWLAWLDSEHEPSQEQVSFDEFVKPIVGRSDVTILQRYITAADIIRRFCDLRFAFRFEILNLRGTLRKACSIGELDFYGLVCAELRRGFWNSAIARLELMESAYSKCFEKDPPKIVLGFLEHFLSTRAAAVAIARLSPRPKLSVIQHASYNREKTFLFFDKELEFNGGSDGCPIPRPDEIFLMGRDAESLFLECGYSKTVLHHTGSSRYDHIRLPESTPSSEAGPLTILILASLSTRIELDLLEGVKIATAGLKNVRVVFRRHPFSRIAESPRFAELIAGIEVSSRSLEEEFTRAHLIIFTYSTTAEESYLAGKPVWQWIPLGFSGSALVDVADIPRFGTVNSLHDALGKVLSGEVELKAPSYSERDRVLKELFISADGCASERIAEVISRSLDNSVDLGKTEEYRCQGLN